jgi:hypothetical protein
VTLERGPDDGNFGGENLSDDVPHPRSTPRNASRPRRDRNSANGEAEASG